MQPTRPFPRPGASVLVTHFGGQRESAVIAAVHDGGRRLDVLCESGERIEFALSMATARFTAAGRSGGPLLELLE